MVEETQPRLDVALTVAVEVYLDVDIGLLGSTHHLGSTLATIGNGYGASPALAGITTERTVYLQEAAADVGSKLAVSISVADDIAMLDVVVGIVEVFLDQSELWFAVARMLFRKAGVDKDFVKLHAFALQRIENEVLYGPEGVFRKGFGAQSVLIAHHDKLIVSMLAQESEAADSLGYKLQFLEGINLFVLGFTNQGAVTVYKENLLHGSYGEKWE